mgnify:CR=1 FL=1
MTRTLLAAIFLLLAAPLQADESLDAMYRAHAQAQGLDWRLVKAIAIVESSENTRAINARDPSIGIMQIHCTEGMQGRCANRFDITGWSSVTRDALFDVQTNIGFGTKILSWNIRTYGFQRGIAIYNSWPARLTPAGKPFPNQSYVDKVLHTYRQLQQQ